MRTLQDSPLQSPSTQALRSKTTAEDLPVVPTTQCGQARLMRRRPFEGFLTGFMDFCGMFDDFVWCFVLLVLFFCFVFLWKLLFVGFRFLNATFSREPLLVFKGLLSPCVEFCSVLALLILGLWDDCFPGFLSKSLFWGC